MIIIHISLEFFEDTGTFLSLGKATTFKNDMDIGFQFVSSLFLFLLSCSSAGFFVKNNVYLLGFFFCLSRLMKYSYMLTCLFYLSV